MIDKSQIIIMAHILIRDPDTDEVILQRRDPTVQSDENKEKQKDRTHHDI